MSEKATLLTSIPPVKKSDSNESGMTLLTPPGSSGTSPGGTKTSAKVSLLSQTKDKTPEKSTTIEPAPNQTVGELVEVASPTDVAVAVEGVPAAGPAGEEPLTITSFQYATYASFVLNFLLAGAAAVVLFKKASKLAEERFVLSTRALATACVIILLHGLFATYLYSSHLNEAVSSAPLFMTMAVWVLVGPAVGFIVRNLLARQEKPNRNAAIVDGVIYGFIFLLSACAVSEIKTNAALLSAIIAGFIMIVPIARSMTAFKVARARHKELNETSDLVLIYGLLLLPAIVPILAFAHVCGLSDALTLFLINFVTLDFVLIVGLAMIASADELIPDDSSRDDTAPAKAASSKKGATPGQSIDPIIQFLNEDEDSKIEPVAPARPAAKAPVRKLPPRKAGSAADGLKAPKKPGVKPSGKPPAAPNAPSRLKAPAKPKKRF